MANLSLRRDGAYITEDKQFGCIPRAQGRLPAR
jgi:hypothetical protein